MNKEFDYPRDFKGIWLPKEIWLDDDLNAVDKIIFAEIYSLDVDGSDGCYASNEYLSNFCKCSVTKVSTSISKLIKRGYIKVAKTDGRTRWLKASLSKFESQTNENKKSESQEMKESNIDIDNIKDNKADTSSNDNVKADTAFPKKSLNVPKQKKTRSELIELEKDMYMRFGIIGREYDVSETAFKNIIRAFSRYLIRHRQQTGKTHPILKDETLEKIFVTLASIQDFKYNHFDNIADYEPEDGELSYLEQMVDEHFDSKHKKDTDWHMSHFAVPEYLEKIAQHVTGY